MGSSRVKRQRQAGTVPLVRPAGTRQMQLFKSNGAGFSDPAFSENRSEGVHRWVPWIAGFSSRFVAEAIERHLPRGGLVMDPFAGVGTTIVEAVRRGPRFRAVGFETNPYAAFAAQTKVAGATANPHQLREAIRRFGREAEDAQPLQPPAGFRSRVPFFSRRVESQVLKVLGWIQELSEPTLHDLFSLAFAAVMVKFSNYTYEPSLGTRRGAGKPDICDAPVVSVLQSKLLEMAYDIESLQSECPTPGKGIVHGRTWRTMGEVLQRGSVNLVVTSPPYANNYHYLRNTRPQLWWLGFVTSTDALREIEDSNFGKFWQTVREQPEIALSFSFPALEALLNKIRRTKDQRRVYDGHGWANYLATYFNDSFDFLRTLAGYLAPGGHALVVIGNSVVQGHEVKTDEIWADIARSRAVGLAVESINVVRKKRVGNSIINSSVRNDAARGVRLYEAILELRRPES